MGKRGAGSWHCSIRGKNRKSDRYTERNPHRENETEKHAQKECVRESS